MIYNNSDAFNNVNTKFYSCNTGTEVDGTSFAQEWVNKVGGTTKQYLEVEQTITALIREETRIGSKRDRWRRYFGKGYEESGCLYYPVTGKNAKWGTYKKIKCIS